MTQNWGQGQRIRELSHIRQITYADLLVVLGFVSIPRHHRVNLTIRHVATRSATVPNDAHALCSTAQRGAGCAVGERVGAAKEAEPQVDAARGNIGFCKHVECGVNEHEYGSQKP